MRDTGPRLGPVSLQDVGRAGLEAAPPLAAYGVGEALGLENNEKKQLAITGLMGTAAISHSINRGNLRKTPWMSAVYLAEKEDRPKFLRKGYGLLLDIIERPDQYDLSKLPPEAGTALDALQEMRQSWVAEVNAQRLDAGLPPIALSEYSTDPQTTQALLSRAVEAQITDAAVARGVVEKLGERIVISSDTLIYPVLNGFGVKKGNSEVKSALEEGLKKFSATPEYAALLKKYHFQPPTEEDLKTLMPKAE